MNTKDKKTVLIKKMHVMPHFVQRFMRIKPLYHHNQISDSSLAILHCVQKMDGYSTDEILLSKEMKKAKMKAYKRQVH